MYNNLSLYRDNGLKKLALFGFDSTNAEKLAEEALKAYDTYNAKLSLLSQVGLLGKGALRIISPLKAHEALHGPAPKPSNPLPGTPPNPPAPAPQGTPQGTSASQGTLPAAPSPTALDTQPGTPSNPPASNGTLPAAPTLTFGEPLGFTTSSEDYSAEPSTPTFGEPLGFTTSDDTLPAAPWYLHPLEAQSVTPSNPPASNDTLPEEPSPTAPTLTFGAPEGPFVSYGSDLGSFNPNDLTTTVHPSGSDTGINEIMNKNYSPTLGRIPNITVGKPQEQPLTDIFTSDYMLNNIAPSGALGLGIGALAGALSGGLPVKTGLGAGAGAFGGKMLYDYLANNEDTKLYIQQFLDWASKNLWDGAGKHVQYLAPILGGLAGFAATK